MDHVELFLLATGALAVTAVCRRWGLPVPLVLVAVGLLVSFVPGVPRYEVDPELLLEFVLPPLLYSSALSSSYQDFRASLRPIARLGVLLVLVSAVAVAVVAWLLVPDLPFAAALVLGAVVAPPDAVAAAAVGRRLGLPRRVMTLLSGESLINDATSLTLYKVALAGVATGAWSLGAGLRTFGLAVVVGVGLGFVVGVVVHRVRLRLDDAVVASAVGLLTPFAAFWAAEAVQGSGVLAVVTAGLYLGHTSLETGYSTRLYQGPLWSTVDLLLEGFTFALIGIQLQWVLADVRESGAGLAASLGVALAVLATAVLVRPLYLFATAPLRARASTGPPGWGSVVRDTTVLSWAGMRGVVTLAAAAAIPATTGGEDFPARSVLQFTAYVVAIGTLLLQGTTLPWVIRRMGVGSDDDEIRDARQEAQVRILLGRAAADVVHAREERWARDIGPEAAGKAVRGITSALSRAEEAAAVVLDPSRAGDDPAHPSPERGRRLQELRREMVATQRDVLRRQRDAGELDETVMRRVLRELDLEDEAVASSWLTSRRRTRRAEPDAGERVGSEPGGSEPGQGQSDPGEPGQGEPAQGEPAQGEPEGGRQEPDAGERGAAADGGRG
ncbi:cation:proton antiporter [Cellulomonas aerilata]|uniref:Putative Na+/H+ antiporter n=1 Tax=Cellulomonas aerilata TaxID=515326 RepID=A0A512DGI5_9CELL|nr:cation:proton antiporter [Cellulomonas aerilata]GEO35300.1 putative Na+/H+ antiporter [Cellulomonas aerilata]